MRDVLGYLAGEKQSETATRCPKCKGWFYDYDWDNHNCKGIPVDLQVMPLLIKDEIVQKLVDRLNNFERQMQSDYGFANKQKIAHKIKELKKCIRIVQST